MDYTYAALAGAFFVMAFMALFKDSTKVALSLLVLGGALAYDAVPRDLPRGIVAGAAFALVVVAWIVGAVVVIQRQRRRSRDFT